MYFKVLIEHSLGGGVLVLEDRESLFHAKNARPGLEGFHRIDDVARPFDVDGH